VLPLAAAAINQSCDRGEEVNQGLEISLGAIQPASLLGGRFKILYSWLHFPGGGSKYCTAGFTPPGEVQNTVKLA
jgi:hypothetical protein